MDVWKQIAGYEGLYEVSNLGNVKSLKRKAEAILSPRIKFGYHFVRLYDRERNWKQLAVHRLVASSFIIPCTDKQVNHINGDRKDNRVENLEWCSNRENCTHRGLHKKKTSKYIGVCKDTFTGRWQSQIYINGKSKKVGRYDTEELAYAAYLDANKKNNIKNKYAGNGSI